MDGDRRRDLGGDLPENEGTLKRTYDQSWAVVIGIDNYTWPSRLQSAVHDATEVAALLVSRLGFPARNLFLVLDPPPTDNSRFAELRPQVRSFEERATKEVIEELLCTKIAELAGVDDRVLVYFAGHGTSRIRPGRDAHGADPYLLPANASKDRWHTYINLNNLLEESQYTKAKHVFYVLDACCGGLAGLRGGVNDDAGSAGLMQRRARQCLTAGTAEQSVADSGKEGHSIFTWHLLNALRSGAGPEAAGELRASQLIATLKERVMREPGHQQIPDGFPIEGSEGGDFGLLLPRTLACEERARLAHLLTAEFGARLNELTPVRLADELWRTVLSELPLDAPDAVHALRERGRTALMLGQLDRALATLQDPRLGNDADAIWLRAAALLRSRKPDEALAALAELASRFPDHALSDWARVVVATGGRGQGRRFALLVGVQTNALRPLQGCDNDVQAMARLLRERFGYEVRTLLGEAATTAAIKEALEGYQPKTTAQDALLFYFSGTGFLRKDENGRERAFYLTHDANPEQPDTLLSELDVDARLRAVRTRDKLVITDACHMSPPVLTSALDYRFLSACDRDGMSLEKETPEGARRGAFTYALEQALSERGDRELYVLASKLEFTRYKTQKRGPVYVGPLAIGLTFSPPELDVLAVLLRPTTTGLPRHALGRLLDWVEAGAVQLPVTVRASLGRALLEASLFERAARLLEPLDPVTCPEALWMRILAHLCVGDAARAREIWDGAPRACQVPQWDELGGPLAALGERRGRAALVCWEDEDVALLRRLEAALVARCGFAPDGVEVLCRPSGGATRAALDHLRQAPPDGQRLFLWYAPAGQSSQLSLEAGPVVWPSELTSMAGGPEGLVMVILSTRDIGNLLAPPTGGAMPQVLITGSPTSAQSPHRDLLGFAKLPDLPALIAALGAHGTSALTARQWLRLAGRPEGIEVEGAADAPLFRPAGPFRQATSLLQALDQRPLDELERLLQRLSEAGDLAPDALLNLGLLEMARHPESSPLSYIEWALSLRRPEPALANASQSSAAGEVVRWADAHSLRGRALAQVGRLAEALGALELAIQQDPDDARAHFHRARTIQRLIKEDLQKKADQSRDQYIGQGSPYGDDPTEAELD